MNDTPRTDQFIAFRDDVAKDRPIDYRDDAALASFARQLERELAASAAQLSRTVDEYKRTLARAQKAEAELSQKACKLSLFESAVAHALESPKAHVSSSNGWTMMRSERATDLACAEEQRDAALAALREAIEEVESMCHSESYEMPDNIDEWRKVAGLYA